MGIINSGFLIKVRKSAGGINFYNRLGVQCFRNKPQISPNYVPTVSQRFQRTTFGMVAAFIMSSDHLQELIDGGWGMKSGKTGATNRNRFTKAVLDAISRNPDGSQLPYADRISNTDNFASDPAEFFRTRVPLTKSAYPILVATPTIAAASGNVEISIPADVIENYRQMLAERNGRYNNALAPYLIVKGGYVANDPEAPIAIEQMTEATGTFTASFPGSLPATAAEGQIAVGFLASNPSGVGLLTDWAVTEALTVTYPTA